MTGSSDQPIEQTALAIDMARTFLAPAGARVLAHLQRLTRDRVLGPESTDAVLRHLEGQRALVLHIENLIARGRQPINHPQPDGDDHHD